MPTIRMSSLLDRNVLATDGDVGTLYDVYFSDDTWQVEHLVLQTGPYFKSRRLIMDPGLLLPESGHDGNDSSGEILVATTREAILACPDYLDDPPVSEQKAHDPALHPHFLWFPTGDTTKMVLRPLGAGVEALEGDRAENQAKGLNPSLQSFREVRGYAVYPAMGKDELKRTEMTGVGHVEDLLLNPQSMLVEQVLIHTEHGLTPDALAVQPCDVKNIDWSDVHLYLNCTRAELGMPVA